MGTRPEEFWRVSRELEPEPFEVVFESTFGRLLADLLADAGIPSHMAHPLATRAIAAGRVKNDAVDAQTLAHLLRGNLGRHHLAELASTSLTEGFTLRGYNAVLGQDGMDLTLESGADAHQRCPHPR